MSPMDGLADKRPSDKRRLPSPSSRLDFVDRLSWLAVRARLRRELYCAVPFLPSSPMVARAPTSFFHLDPEGSLVVLL
jgi:hypothetical protein